VGERVDGIVFDEAWTADGDYLAVLGNKRGQSEIVRLDPDGAAPRREAGPALGEYPAEPAYRLAR
jgi:Tol biopolymer transport system component